MVRAGLGEAGRNALIAHCGALVAVGGGAGTLSELANAWSLKRPLIVFTNVSGISAALAGLSMDQRGVGRVVHGVESVAQLVEMLANVGIL